MPDCDILLPLGQDLSALQRCLENLLAVSDPAHYHLYLLDDGCDQVTAAYLSQLCHAHPQLSRHVVTAPASLQALSVPGTAPILLWLTPEVLLPPQWWPRLQAALQARPAASVVLPVNASPACALPMLPGSHCYRMDEFLQQQTPQFPSLSSAALVNNRCGLWRRAALANPTAVVLADNLYVWAAGSPSTGDQLPMSLHQACRLPQRWQPMPVVWTTYRAMLSAWRQRRWWTVLHAGWQGFWRMLRQTRDFSNRAAVARLDRPGRLRVTYVLHELVIAGGVLSVMQLVNGLILQGVDARIVALFEDPLLQAHWPLLTRPLLFRRPAELITHCPDSEVLVATHWVTAAWVAAIQQRGGIGHTAYFLQDYESWFYPESDHQNRQRVLATYPLIAHRIVKSAWLQAMLSADGYATHKIRLGMDLRRFYPRDVPPAAAPLVLAMARPRTARRGFASVIAALALVKAARPAVQIALFGDNLLFQQDIPFAYQDLGVVNDQDALARLYSSAEVFLDGSDFQGFGRLGLEAMACGTACVLTGVGGVTEYARHAVNCLVVPPQQPDAFAAAILQILDEPALAAQLVAGGLATARDYDVDREVRETLEYFQQLVAGD